MLLKTNENKGTNYTFLKAALLLMPPNFKFKVTEEVKV